MSCAEHLFFFLAMWSCLICVCIMCPFQPQLGYDFCLPNLIPLFIRFSCCLFLMAFLHVSITNNMFCFVLLIKVFLTNKSVMRFQQEVFCLTNFYCSFGFHLLPVWSACTPRVCMCFLQVLCFFFTVQKHSSKVN